MISIITICGGIALFLIGLNSMRDNLLKLLNYESKRIIYEKSSSIIVSFIIGVFLTIIMQSSNAITAITIAFLSSKIISLPAALSIVLGSNIGTTFTSLLFTFDIGDYSLAFVFVGFCLCCIKKEVLGNLIYSLGFIFLGINISTTAFSHLANSNIFEEMMLYTNKFSLLLLGSFVSFMLQSSSATIAIIQNLYSINVISLSASIALVFGANIGTTISSIIPSINNSNDTKKLVWFNIGYNVIGGVIFLLLLNPFKYVILLLENPNNLRLSIFYIHIIFNVVTSLIALVIVKIWTRRLT